MDNERAKTILAAYRSSGKDAGDPCFAEALDQARKDPTLSEWFREQTEFDAAAREAFRAVQPPPCLLGEALTAVRLSKPEHPLRSTRRTPRWALALAACIAIFAGSAALVRNGFPGLSTRESQRSMAAAGSAQPGKTHWSMVASEIAALQNEHRISLGRMSGQIDELDQWLRARQSPCSIEVPQSLRGRNSLGCQTYQFGEVRVSLICFNLGQDKVAHLFVMSRAAIQDAPEPGAPAQAVDVGIQMVAWSAGQRSYILTSEKLDTKELLELIGPPKTDLALVALTLGN